VSNAASPRIDNDALTGQIIGAAIEVHRRLGPGLLESAYESCLCYELILRNLKVERQKALPIVYRDVKLDSGYRLDLIVENEVVVEIKSISKLLPIHEFLSQAQWRRKGVTYQFQCKTSKKWYSSTHCLNFLLLSHTFSVISLFSVVNCATTPLGAPKPFGQIHS